MDTRRTGLSVTNTGDVPVHNVWAAVEGPADRRVPAEDLPSRLLLPGQSAM